MAQIERREGKKGVSYLITVYGVYGGKMLTANKSVTEKHSPHPRLGARRGRKKRLGMRLANLRNRSSKALRWTIGKPLHSTQNMLSG